MLEIHNLDLTNKTILEVGTGRGGTTLEMIPLLEKYPTAKLITTDIVDVDVGGEFQQYCEGLGDLQKRIQFLQADATELGSLPDESIDIICVNYTLCAINSIGGKLTLALDRFYHLLKPKGMLLIEEEYPIDCAQTAHQKLWADKWRSIKTALLSSGNLCYNEIHPDLLVKMLSILNFQDIDQENGLTMLHHSEVLPLFDHQIHGSLSPICDPNLQKGLVKWVNKIKKTIRKLEFMEIPYFRMMAKKR